VIVAQANGESILKTGNQHARDLAQAILRLSSDNCSAKGMADGLRGLKFQLKEFGFRFNDVYAAHASSSGNLLGYLFRKNNHSQMAINDLDNLTKVAELPKKIFLFDDLSTLKLSPEKTKLLQSIPQVVVGDLASFEKGINYLDFAKGDNFVARKLAGLVEEAKALGRQNPNLTTSQLACELLANSSRLAAQTRLRELSASPSAQKKMVVVMDDIIYTGTQVWQRLNYDSDVLGNFKHVAVGCLGAFEDGRKKILEPEISSRFYDPTKVSLHAPEIKTADWYEGAIIFDIAGNNFQLIAVCRFELGRLYIEKVMTHQEYDKGAWKTATIKGKPRANNHETSFET